MVEIATAAALISGASLGYSIFSGERGETARRKGKRDQQRAQSTAQGRALREEQRAAEAENKATQKKPDLRALLDRNQPKPASLGVSPSQLLLGNRFLGN